MNFLQKKYPHCVCVYKITNIINEKIYIGSSIDFCRRVKRHKYDLIHKVHRNSHLQHAFDLYGIANFEIEILKTFACKTSIEILHQNEQKFIDSFNACNPDFGYNLMKVDTPRSFFSLSQEAQQKIIAHINKLKIPVLAFDKYTGEFLKEYDSVSSAARDYHTSSTNISAVCKHKMKYFKTAIFIYKSEYDSNKTYKYIYVKRTFSNSHIQKSRKNCKRNIQVKKFDLNGNLICIFQSKAEMRRIENLNSHFLKYVNEEYFKNYIYKAIID